MSAHTPTPWYQHTADLSRIVSANELAVATVYDADDGAHIVRAVNAQHDLVVALEELLEIYIRDQRADYPDVDPLESPAVKSALAALAKAAA